MIASSGQTFILTEAELESLLVRSARIGAEQAMRVPPPVMTKAQLCEYLDKPVSTINRYMREGMPYRKEGNDYPEFYRVDVDRWLAERFR